MWSLCAWQARPGLLLPGARARQDPLVWQNGAGLLTSGETGFPSCTPGRDSSKRKGKGVSSQAASPEGRCGGEVFHTDRHPGETGKTQAPVPAPQLWGDPAKETEKVCQRPIGSSERGGSGGGLGPSSHRPFGEGRGDQELGASGAGGLASSGETQRKRKTQGEVCQGPGESAGLPSASRWPFPALQGCQELAVSGGLPGLGPQLRGDPVKDSGQVCQGPAKLPSGNRRWHGGLQGWQEVGASGGSPGSASQPVEDSPEETGDVSQGPGGLASASRWCLWLLHGSPQGSQGSAPQLSATGGSILRPSLRACPGPRDTCPSGLCPLLHTLPPGFGLAAVRAPEPPPRG
ncbi:hypothetical protein R6Z07_011486 [Ovis aries]